MRVRNSGHLLGGVALLSAEVDLAASADVVARVDLGLSSEALEVGANGFMGVDEDLHRFRGRVELDQPGVDRVSVRADVEPPVEARDD